MSANHDEPLVLVETERVREVLGDEFLWKLGEALQQLREAISISTPDDEPDEDEEGQTYHGIVRYTHVRCGYTTRKRAEMEMLNDLDPGCPECLKVCRPPSVCDDQCTLAYGAMVWENADGTIVETYSNRSELVTHQPVRTHVQVYKAWTNDPDNGEWWIVPRPNTGDIDGSDNLIVGFDTYQQALYAVTSGGLRTTFAELCTERDGIAWRDRHDPIYQTTPPKEGQF